MRFVKPRTVAAAATSLALASAGATAASAHPLRVPHRAGAALGCRVSMFAEPHLVTTGEAAQLFGVLKCTSLASDITQPVTVYQHVAGTPGFKVAGTATTGAGGFYSFVAPALSANSVFYAVAGGRRSPSRTVRVAPVVTLTGPTQSAALLTGPKNTATFTGTVNPGNEGTQIALQREASTSNEEWATIQFGVVGAKGAYSITHRFTFPGDANIRVLVRSHGHQTVRGISNTLSYVISQPQNPALTVGSKPQIAVYGEPIVISGTLAGGKEGKVTLLSHPRGGGPFTKVDEKSTNATGEYTFTETALHDGPYRVLGSNGQKSSIVYEGVRYVLTAGASAVSAPAGQAVTFSGTVTPIVAGHPVYLERENVGGHGFHAVDVGTVTGGGTYSITHYVFGSGKQVFRVHIPGDPANQGSSSQSFPVEVTAPVPGSLRPVPAARQPLEGKI